MVNKKSVIVGACFVLSGIGAYLAIQMVRAAPPPEKKIKIVGFTLEKA